MQDAGATRFMPLVAIIAFTMLVLAVFHPALDFEFVNLDVGKQIFQNPHVQGITWENVKYLFTTRCVTSYYPIRSLSFALDYQFWGLNPTGFKLTNILIHLANAVLLFWLVLRLFSQPQCAITLPCPVQWEVPLAAFAAAIFAIHPLVVEPVAWVSGREELLMTCGALACIHFHLSACRLAESGRRCGLAFFCHFLAAISCAAACMSNAVAAVIPILVVAWDVLTIRKPTLWRILTGTAALWIIAIATIVLKKVGEFNDPPNQAGAFSAERLCVLFNVFWLNVKSLVWPSDLAVFYPEIAPQGFGDPAVILGAMAFTAALVLLWLLRRQKLIVLGLVWFAVGLGPSSQIMIHHIHRADRFLYLPLAGLAIAMAMSLRVPANAAARSWAKAGIVLLGISLLFVLGKRSASQVWTWHDDISMWETCVKLDPGNVRFRCELADRLRLSGHHRQALREYEHLLQSDPHNGKVAVKLAWLLVTSDETEIRDPDRAIRLAEQAAARNPALFRSYAQIRTEVARGLAAEHQFPSAVENLRLALEADPGSHAAMLELASLLATCSDLTLRDPAQAVELAERACLVQSQLGPEELGIVAAVYFEAGRPRLAVSAAEKALGLAQASDSGNTGLLEDLRKQLEFYRDQCCDETPPNDGKNSQGGVR